MLLFGDWQTRFQVWRPTCTSAARSGENARAREMSTR